MISGDTDVVKHPKNGFPYIPGGDICGTVIAIDDDNVKFSIGDVIIATWYMFGEGGISEYCLVETSLSFHKPSNVSVIEGAALANSSVHAMMVVK